MSYLLFDVRNLHFHGVLVKPLSATTLSASASYVASRKVNIFVSDQKLSVFFVGAQMSNKTIKSSHSLVAVAPVRI